MSGFNTKFRLPEGVVAELKLKSIETLLKEIGLDSDGSLQTFHTANVLRRITKYMAFRTGLTIKVTIAQTNINVPEIVMDYPYAGVLFRGKRKRKKITYTKTKNALAGPRPDKAVEAAEGAAMAADLMREIRRRGIP